MDQVILYISKNIHKDWADNGALKSNPVVIAFHDYELDLVAFKIFKDYNSLTKDIKPSNTVHAISFLLFNENDRESIAKMASATAFQYMENSKLDYMNRNNTRKVTLIEMNISQFTHINDIQSFTYNGKSIMQYQYPMDYAIFINEKVMGDKNYSPTYGEILKALMIRKSINNASKTNDVSYESLTDLRYLYCIGSIFETIQDELNSLEKHIVKITALNFGVHMLHVIEFNVA